GHPNPASPGAEARRLVLPAGQRIAGDRPLIRGSDRGESAWVGDHRWATAAEHDRLEVLRSQDGPKTHPRSRERAVGDDARKTDEPLARGSDRQYVTSRMRRLECVRGLRRVETPDSVGRFESG